MDKLKPYAQIILKTGVNLRKGQSLRILTTAEDYGFARILGQEAYREGAQYVHIEMADNYLLKTRIENQKEEQLDHIPDFIPAFFKEMLKDDWATIRLAGKSESHVLKESDSTRLSRYTKAISEKLHFHSKSLMADEHSWCVVAVPGPTWAKRILGEDATTDQLWEVIDPILRLNSQDPMEAQHELNRSLHERCHKLNKYRFDKIRFESEGTDLTIGLCEKSLWVGGPLPLPSGRMYNGNIPSEEVFTTPDRSRTEGTVTMTKPATVMGKQVLGMKLRFEKGKIVEYSADEGEDVLREYLNREEALHFLGEVALVPNSSPISMSGLVFQSLLYDENASCHIAVGAGYPSCLEGFRELDTDEKLKEAGCNVAMGHCDFMIGSEKTKITATTRDGKEIVIMEEGEFTL